MLTIRRDDFTGPGIRALLEEHLRSMYELSPPESVHAFDVGKLQQPVGARFRADASRFENLHIDIYRHKQASIIANMLIRVASNFYGDGMTAQLNWPLSFIRRSACERD